MADVRLKAYAAAIAVLVADRSTKWLVETHVSFLDTWRVIPGFFDIVHTENRGVAFSLFNESASEWRQGLLVLFSLAMAAAVIAVPSSLSLWWAGISFAEPSGWIAFLWRASP